MQHLNELSAIWSKEIEMHGGGLEYCLEFFLIAYFNMKFNVSFNIKCNKLILGFKSINLFFFFFTQDAFIPCAAMHVHILINHG